MSPLPYQVLCGSDKAQKIRYILSWSDFGCENELPWETFQRIVAIIAPLMQCEELGAYWPVGKAVPVADCQHIIVRKDHPTS